MTELDGQDAQIAREKAAKHPNGIRIKDYQLPVTTAEKASERTLSGYLKGDPYAGVNEYNSSSKTEEDKDKFNETQKHKYD